MAGNLAIIVEDIPPSRPSDELRIVNSVFSVLHC